MLEGVTATPEQLNLIRQLDLEHWESYAPNPNSRLNFNDRTVYNCRCPECHGRSKRKKRSPDSSHALTAIVYLHRGKDGLGFKCAACGVHYPSVYRFLRAKAEGSAKAGQYEEAAAAYAKAEAYAEKRFTAGCAGQGWGCPQPQRIKQELEEQKRQRGIAHRAADEAKKRANKIAYELRQASSVKTEPASKAEG